MSGSRDALLAASGSEERSPARRRGEKKTSGEKRGRNMPQSDGGVHLDLAPEEPDENVLIKVLAREEAQQQVRQKREEKGKIEQRLAAIKTELEMTESNKKNGRISSGKASQTAMPLLTEKENLERELAEIDAFDLNSINNGSVSEEVSAVPEETKKLAEEKKEEVTQTESAPASSTEEVMQVVPLKVSPEQGRVLSGESEPDKSKETEEKWQKLLSALEELKKEAYEKILLAETEAAVNALWEKKNGVGKNASIISFADVRMKAGIDRVENDDRYKAFCGTLNKTRYELHCESDARKIILSLGYEEKKDEVLDRIRNAETVEQLESIGSVHRVRSGRSSQGKQTFVKKRIFFEFSELSDDLFAKDGDGQYVETRTKRMLAEFNLVLRMEWGKRKKELNGDVESLEVAPDIVDSENDDGGESIDDQSEIFVTAEVKPEEQLLPVVNEMPLASTESSVPVAKDSGVIVEDALSDDADSDVPIDETAPSSEGVALVYQSSLDAAKTYNEAMRHSVEEREREQARREELEERMKALTAERAEILSRIQMAGASLAEAERNRLEAKDVLDRKGKEIVSTETAWKAKFFFKGTSRDEAIANLNREKSVLQTYFDDCVAAADAITKELSSLENRKDELSLEIESLVEEIGGVPVLETKEHSVDEGILEEYRKFGFTKEELLSLEGWEALPPTKGGHQDVLLALLAIQERGDDPRQKIASVVAGVRGATREGEAKTEVGDESEGESLETLDLPELLGKLAAARETYARTLANKESNEEAKARYEAVLQAIKEAKRSDMKNLDESELKRKIRENAAFFIEEVDRLCEAETNAKAARRGVFDVVETIGKRWRSVPLAWKATLGAGVAGTLLIAPPAGLFLRGIKQLIGGSGLYVSLDAAMEWGGKKIREKQKKHALDLNERAIEELFQEKDANEASDRALAQYDRFADAYAKTLDATLKKRRRIVLARKSVALVSAALVASLPFVSSASVEDAAPEAVVDPNQVEVPTEDGRMIPGTEYLKQVEQGTDSPAPVNTPTNTPVNATEALPPDSPEVIGKTMTHDTQASAALHTSRQGMGQIQNVSYAASEQPTPEVLLKADAQLPASEVLRNTFTVETGGSVEGTIAKQLQLAGMLPQESGRLAHRMLVEYANEAGKPIDAFDRVSSGMTLDIESSTSESSPLRIASIKGEFLHRGIGSGGDVAFHSDINEPVSYELPEVAASESAETTTLENADLPPETREELARQQAEAIADANEKVAADTAVEEVVPNEQPADTLSSIDEKEVASLSEAQGEMLESVRSSVAREYLSAHPEQMELFSAQSAQYELSILGQAESGDFTSPTKFSDISPDVGARQMFYDRVRLAGDGALAPSETPTYQADVHPNLDQMTTIGEFMTKAALQIGREGHPLPSESIREYFERVNVALVREGKSVHLNGDTKWLKAAARWMTQRGTAI